MKLVGLGPDDVFHRYLTPKWAYVPLSGAGAAAGHGGLLFPSTRHDGGVNLALYPQNLGPADIVRVHDPDRRLPHDQSSWR